MKTQTLPILLLATLTLSPLAPAQAPPPSPSPSPSQLGTRNQELATSPLDFGTAGLTFPPATVRNSHSPRTVDLLGEAYRKKDPVVTQRVRYIADLGATALPAAAPYLIDATRDPAPEARAEAARAAASVADPSLLAPVEKLLSDPDDSVRREATLAAATLARKHNQPTTAIAKGLADASTSVLAAALQSAYLPEHAAPIAQKLPTLPDPLKPEAALTLARLQAKDHAASLLPLLSADVLQKIAALRALASFADPAHAAAALALLKDPHPTVRREAALTLTHLADPSTREARAIQLLADPDPTVRQAAATVLTPLPSAEALDALLPQLDTDYAPLHNATRQSLIRPANDGVRASVIRASSALLTHVNRRRSEDGSYVLGHLKSDAAFETHLSLLSQDTPADWSLIAQVAESMGLINDPRAIPPLMVLVKASPEVIQGSVDEQRAIGRAVGNAMVALARLQHRPALTEATRVLALEPGGATAPLRAGSAFAAGLLSDPKSPPLVDKMFSIYEDIYEDRLTKFEALKALGNLRHQPSADRLKRIYQSEPSVDLRWIAHWAYQRCSGQAIPYVPPEVVNEPPVVIMDLGK